MEAHPRTLRSVFRPDLRLTVPLFQRPYVWDAEPQWQPLWEDVLVTLDRTHAGDRTPHFLGAVVLEQKRGALGSLETREVIDGQQRLTTLQLLVAAVRDGFVQRGVDERAARRLTRLLENDPDLLEEPDEKHRLWPTNRDRDAYREVMNGAHRGSPYASTQPRMVAAYTWFSAALDDHLADRPEDDAAAEITMLADVLVDGLEVVVIDLGENDNAQVIFETLNARGTPLRASDLIKNLLFRTLQDAQCPVEDLYKRHWEALENAQWQVDVRQGRMTRPRLDAFMGHFLVVLMQSEVQAHQLFPVVRAHVDNDSERAAQFLRELSRYAGVYERLDRLESDDPEEAASLRRLQIVDTQTLTPVLLWLFANTAGADRRRAVQALESYVVRRSLCRLTTKNYNRLFLELLRRLGTGHGAPGELVETYLAGHGSESGMWPTDQELARSLETLPLYRLVKREQLQRALFALEVHATTARTEAAAWGRKLSIEHLMPQQWRSTWPLPGDDENEDGHAVERDELIHTIGNLTLVTGTLNSAMSNAAWDSKRRHLLEHSALTLNRSLPQHWDDESIRARSQWLAQLAADLWVRPEPRESGPVFADDSERVLRPDREAEPDARPAGNSRGRRDIARHIEHVFSTVEPDTFLTIAEIRRRPSPEYADTAPSSGAISARLFPANGRTTVAGIVPETRNGVRGGRRASTGPT